jgi:hypothetical protein
MLGTNDKARTFACCGSLFEGSDIKHRFKTPAGGQFYGADFDDTDQDKICVRKTNFSTIAIKN